MIQPINENEFPKYTKQYFRKYLIKLLTDKYKFEVMNASNRESIVTEINAINKLATEYNVDIHDIFPIIVDCGAGIRVKFYQNGDVYLYGDNGCVACLHESVEDTTEILKNVETEVKNV